MKNEKKQKDDFRKELDAYQAQGIPLWLLFCVEQPSACKGGSPVIF